MKNNIKKYISILLSVVILLTNVSTDVFANEQNTELEKKYIEIYEKYKSLENNKLNLLKNNIYLEDDKMVSKFDFTEEEIITLKDQNIDPDLYEFFAYFKDARFSDLYQYVNGKIVLKEENNIPVLISYENDNELLIQIGYNKYKITAENKEYSLKLIVSLGDKQAILFNEEFYPNDKVNTFNLKSYFDNDSHLLGSGAYWLKESPGIKGETGVWLTVLTVIVDAGGYIISFVFKDPSLKEKFGNLVKWSATSLTVGSLVYQKLYTIRYQSQRSDCRTYVRERKVYYKYNDYTGKIKETFHYFHSERPDYVGGACMLY